jgi:hypothetical protein
MPSSEKLSHVALVRMDVSEECIVHLIRMKIVSDLGTTLTVTLSTSFLQKPRGVTSQKTPFFLYCNLI